MALDATTLKGLMKSNIEAISDFPAVGVHPIFQDDRVLQAIAAAIVTHITTSAVVIPNTLNNPAGQAVVVVPATGIGATSAPQVIAGTGKVT